MALLHASRRGNDNKIKQLFIALHFNLVDGMSPSVIIQQYKPTSYSYYQNFSNLFAAGDRHD